jgi:hypothetical protein
VAAAVIASASLVSKPRLHHQPCLGSQDASLEEREKKEKEERDSKMNWSMAFVELGTEPGDD